LPATRELAAELGVSRNTVMNAFEQLLAEGYVEGRVGSGTYVSGQLPERLLHAAPWGNPSRPVARQRPDISRRGALLAAETADSREDPGKPRAFVTGLPALDAFPFQVWSRLVSRRWRRRWRGPARSIVSGRTWKDVCITTLPPPMRWRTRYHAPLIPTTPGGDRVSDGGAESRRWPPRPRSSWCFTTVR